MLRRQRGRRTFAGLVHRFPEPPGYGHRTGPLPADVWLNGTYLAGSPRTIDAWRQACYVDLAGGLRAGDNMLEVAVRKRRRRAGRAAGAPAARRGAGADLVTDGSWQAAITVPETWVAAEDLGAYGSGPWASAVVAPDNGSVSPVTVAGLTTEPQTDPVGVDVATPRHATPRFGRRLVSGSPGQIPGR
jgi:alpha-L-rhamnosidase